MSHNPQLGKVPKVLNYIRLTAGGHSDRCSDGIEPFHRAYTPVGPHKTPLNTRCVPQSVPQPTDGPNTPKTPEASPTTPTTRRLSHD